MPIGSYILRIGLNKFVPSYSQSYTYGNSIGDLPVAYKEGYSFKGWYTAPNGGTKISTSTMSPSINTTYYAQWQ